MDLHAQFAQLEESRKSVKLNIDAAGAAGAEAEYVERAHAHLNACMWLIAKGIALGVTKREDIRVHGVHITE